MILYAGPLQMLYEHGFLRYISYRDSEILRMIYFALRDENWNTCEHEILSEQKEISWEKFVITYESVNKSEGKDVIRWNNKLEGSADGSIRFTIEGQVLKQIKKNRAGLCVLHPLRSVTGQPVEIVKPSGATQQGNFPIEVSPTNPFKEIRKMKWQFDNRWYELQFEGDVFETEDQRNWIDASFKTFCTPSELPIPVTLSAGDQIFQRVSFKPLEKLQPITSHESTIIALEKTEQRTKLPAIGTCAGLEQQAMHEAAIDRIQHLKLAHLAIEVNSADPQWVSRFSKLCEEAYAYGLPLSIAFHATSFESIEALGLLVQQNRLRVTTITFLSSNQPVTSAEILAQHERVRKLFPTIKLGAGTSGDFKDLNRNRFDASGFDFVSYSAHPQVHAADDRTLIENIDGIRETGRSAGLLYPAKVIHLSPVTLRNPAQQKPDDRQKSDVAGLWTFGALRAAAEGGVSSITLFETIGDNGFVSHDGSPYPVYDILEKVLRFRNHEMIVLRNSEPLLIDAMLFTNDNSTTLMLANYTDDLQTIRYGRNEFQVLPLQVQEVNLSGA